MKWSKALASEETEYGNVVEIDIDKIKLPEGHSPLNQANVERLAESIAELGVLNPLHVTEGALGCYVVILGKHRFCACEVIGLEKVPCFIVHWDKLQLELAQIEENLARNELSPSERAQLVLRRDEIFKARGREHPDGPSQTETRSERLHGSVRDHAERTGQKKDVVARALKRGRALGSEILRRTQGTSLDKDVELDALAKLPDEERQDLADRAAAGEEVSARTDDRRPKERKSLNKMEPPARAGVGFGKWLEQNPCVKEIPVLQRPIAEIKEVLGGDQDMSRTM